MSNQPSGNLRGLAPSQLKMLKRLFIRRIGPDEIVSLDLAREIFGVANELRRRVGVLISREGFVEEVCVGTKDILYLPDLGRHRLGRGRLRALRLVFSDLSDSFEPHIPQDIYTDLEKLRLDAVVGVKIQGNQSKMAYAHLVPEQRTDIPAVRTENIPEISRHELDFKSFISDLEAELSATVSAQRVSDRPGVVLVGVYPKGDRRSDSSMAELEELARTAGVEILDKVIQKREPDPKTVIGKGKLEEVVLRCLRVGAEMIIFDMELRPSQWRAITNLTELKVIDRSMLILDIFAQRAKSSEGRLQVELAQLKYTLPRLVEKDSGLSRLTGGIGGRGPGETKLEIGRRRIRDKIVELEKRIDKIREERQLRRSKRQENAIPLVSILGYTNVGKSTLFNALTGSSVFVEDKLFATLDPAQRRIVISRNIGSDQQPEAKERNDWYRTIVLSDTVGFIRELPEELSTAFRATLEELDEASVLIHVLDASDPDVRDRKEAVENILKEMGIESARRLNVLNKVDLVGKEVVENLVSEFGAIPISARGKVGLEKVLSRIDAML